MTKVEHLIWRALDPTISEEESQRLTAEAMAEARATGVNPVDVNPVAFLDWCALHASRIYVREYLDGKGWGSYSLSELPVSIALGHVRRLMAEGRYPVVIRESGDSIPAGDPAEGAETSTPPVPKKG